MKNVLGALLILTLETVPAWAVLGQYESSVSVDQQDMKSEDRVQDFQAYKVHELTSSNGTTVREYVSPKGLVFGVAWQGPFMPNMEKLLGSYVTNLQTAMPLGGSDRALVRRSRNGSSVLGQQSEEERNQTMTMKNISITTAILITLSLPLAQAGVGMPGTITVAELARETAARKTLTRAQASACVAADEADQLRRIADPMFSPDSHRDKLTALKGKVNRMGQEISSLRAERESLAPWEQQAIDEILPLLQATAENTESAIGYFNEHGDRLWLETYRDYADHIWLGSDQIAKILKNYLKYDRLRDQEVYAEERIRAASQRFDEQSQWGGQ